MKSVLVVHPQFDVIGGAEVVAAQMLRWLLTKKNLVVNLLTLKAFPREQIVHSTGISIPTDRLTVTLAPCPAIVRNSVGRFELLKLAFLHRAARSLSVQFDLCISTYNEIDFGRKGIQYIHHPSFASKPVLQQHHIIPESLNVPFSALYQKFIFLVSGDTNQGFIDNHTVVNSLFMKDVVKDIYGIQANVLYPGFLADKRSSPAMKWEKREFRFLSVGRISPHKEYLRLLDIFKAVHKKYPKASFMIIGSEEDPRYANVVRRRALELGIPVQLKTNITKDELDTLMRTSKFFVHAKEYEHFGIAIVDAANFGCLTFVHDSGGQREIVDHIDMRYAHPEDFLVKIEILLKDQNRRNVALRQLQKHLSKFRAKAFYKGLENHVGQYLK